VLRWYDSKINNGILEGLNSLVQAAKAKARGYRTLKKPQDDNLYAYRQTGLCQGWVTHLK
jgi:hypothetical protein